MTDIVLRSAHIKDCPAICEIMNYEIEHRTSMYDISAKSIQEVEDWLITKQENHFPVHVAVMENEVCAYATYGPFRPKAGYRFTVEHSVYVQQKFQKQGIGSDMMNWLINSARDNGYHSMVAGIDSENVKSIQFHEKFGFKEVARFHEIGFKFDRWLDLIFMQKLLQGN